MYAKKFFLLAMCMSFSFFLFAQINSNIQQATSINTDGTDPHVSALLDVQSISQGMLVPRMTTGQRSMIVTPATGLLVFDMDYGSFWFFDGSMWIDLSASIKELSDADGDTKVQVERTMDEDIIHFVVDTFEFGAMDGKTFHLDAPGVSLFIGKEAGINDDGTNNYNTFLGNQAGYGTNSGYGNTFVGSISGLSNLDGSSNTFVGAFSGHFNPSGSDNTFLGFSAGEFNYGNSNTFLGKYAGYKNITGEHNTYVGSETGNKNAFGHRNVAIGDSALHFNTSNGLVALGYLSGRSNTSGERNTFLGQHSGYWNTLGSRNTYIGDQAGFGSTSGGEGNGNIAIGHSALYKIENGGSNIAIGDSALFNNRVDSGIIAIGAGAGLNANGGTYNTFVGHQSGYHHDNRVGNTYLGYRTGYNNKFGGYNTFIGSLVAESRTNGYFNTVLGAESGRLSIDGSNNTFVGFRSGYNNQGWYNTFIGESAGIASGPVHDNTCIGASSGAGNEGYRNTFLGSRSGTHVSWSGHDQTGSDNVGAGMYTLYNLQEGNNNVALGKNTLYNVKSQNSLVAIGSNAGFSDTSGVSNTYIGNYAGYGARSGSFNTYLGDSTGYHNETGLRNTYIGNHAGYGSETGDDGDGNVAIGSNSLYSIMESNYNTAIGANSMFSNTTGSGNTALGYQAGYSITSFSSFNTLIGNKSGQYMTYGRSNTFLGNRTGERLKNGLYNTFIGAKAGSSFISGEQNICIGLLAGASNEAGSNNICIGNFNSLIDNSADTANASDNIFIGRETGYFNMLNSCDGNIFIGHHAGFLETGNYKLYIENSNSERPLIYGDFTNDFLTVHGKLATGTKQPKHQVHLHKQDNGANYLGFTNQETDSMGNDGVLIGLDANEDFRIHSYEENDIQFYLNNILRMRFGSSAGDIDMKLRSNTGNKSNLQLFESGDYGFEFSYDGSADKLHLWSRGFTGNEAIRTTWLKDGKVGIGTTNPLEALHVNGNAQFDVPDLSALYDLMITGTGKLSVNVSDARLKENVHTLDEALDKVTALRGVSYTWKDDPGAGIRHGLIAQEVKKVIPELVYKRNEYYGLNYSELSGFFVEAIKDLKAKKNELEELVLMQQKLIEKLEERVTRLEGGQ